MSDFRIVSTISPVLYERIIDKPNDENHLVFLKSLFSFITNFKHVIILLLPPELKEIMGYSIEIRLLLNRIMTNVNSNIIFASHLDLDCIELIDDKGNIINSSVNRILSKYINIDIYPIMFAENSYFLHKTKCKTTTNCISKSKHKCSSELNFNVKSITSGTNNILKNYNLDDLKNWILSENKYSIEDLKKLAYLYAFLYEIPDEKVKQFEKIQFLPQFENEIKNVSKKDMFMIATSVFRGTVFPAKTGTEKTIFSLDHHKHHVKNLDEGEHVEGIDVIPPENSGISGKKRIYKASLKKGIFIILYDYEHGDDIDSKTLKKRVDSC